MWPIPRDLSFRHSPGVGGPFLGRFGGSPNQWWRWRTHGLGLSLTLAAFILRTHSFGRTAWPIPHPPPLWPGQSLTGGRWLSPWDVGVKPTQDLKDFGREAGSVSFADVDRNDPGRGYVSEPQPRTTLLITSPPVSSSTSAARMQTALSVPWMART